MPTAISIVCDAYASAATHRDEVKRLKVAIRATARTAKGALDAQAGGAHTVRDVDYAREFFELPEQLLGD